MTKAQQKQLNEFGVKLNEFENRFMKLEAKFEGFTKTQSWMKSKIANISEFQHQIRSDIQGLSFRLFDDEKTGVPGYLAQTKDLQEKHYETNKRIDKLQVVKKFIWASMVVGSGAVGWILRMIFMKQ